MKHGVNYFSSALIAALLVSPLSAWADTKPDFDDDAKPILKMQPGLLRYVETRFDVKGTGTAKYPGDDDHPPSPPFIFRARPLGSNGPYNFRLLIQPGQPGHILGIVDITKVHLPSPANSSSQPAVANQPPPQPSTQPPPQAPAPVAQAPAPTSSSQPTADTPSGPITDSGSSNQPSLAPPPDLAPPAQ